MKHFLLIPLLLITNFLNAQHRIGRTKAEIIKEFANEKFSSTKLNGDQELLLLVTDTVACFYQIDKKGICVMTMFRPLTNLALKHYIENCNKNYIIENDKSWKVYTTDNGIITVKLGLIKDENESFYILSFYSEEAWKEHLKAGGS